MVDVWCLDRFTGEYQDSLEYLNISGCKALNWNGLECVSRLRKLKVLVLHDMEHIKDIDLLCLMLLDILPDLQIQGVDYMANAKNLLADTKHKHLLEDLDKSLLLLTDGLNDGKNAVEAESENKQKSTGDADISEKNIKSNTTNNYKDSIQIGI